MKKVFIFTLALAFILIISPSVEAKKYPLVCEGKRVFGQCSYSGGELNYCNMYLWDGEKAVKICDLGFGQIAMEKDHITWNWGYDAYHYKPQCIYLYDSKTEELISLHVCPPYDEGSAEGGPEAPDVSNGQVVFHCEGFTENGDYVPMEVFFYDGQELSILAHGVIPSSWKLHPYIDNGQIIWWAYAYIPGCGRLELFLYDPAEGEGTIRQITGVGNIPSAWTDCNAWIHNSQIALEVYNERGSVHQIYLYDIKTKKYTCIAPNRGKYPKMHNGWVTWFDVPKRWNIFLYNGEETIQLTDNDLRNVCPMIHNGQAAWTAIWQGLNNPGGAFLYDGENVLQLDDLEGDSNYGLCEGPTVYNGYVAWRRTAFIERKNAIPLYIPPPRPDLKLKDHTYQDQTITLTVYNDGMLTDGPKVIDCAKEGQVIKTFPGLYENATANAGRFKVALYLDETLVETKTVNSLVYGEEITLTFTAIPVKPRGSQLKIILDPEKTVAEHNETNNKLIFNPVKPPELILQEIKVAEKIYPEQPVTVTCQVYNDSTTPADSFEVALYLGKTHGQPLVWQKKGVTKLEGTPREDNGIKRIPTTKIYEWEPALYAGEALIASQRVEALAAGATREVNFTFTPIIPGQFTLRAVADEAQAIEEEEKRNNELIKKVQVGETEYYTLNFDIRHQGALSPGSGTVTLNPAGLTHPFGEEVAYPAGTKVTITANPAPGYVFHSVDSWIIEDGRWFSHTNPTTITLDTHKHISVNFIKGIQIRPDVNRDGQVNVLDMILIGQRWGETGVYGWIFADVNRDGKIDELDMILVGQHWTG